MKRINNADAPSYLLLKNEIEETFGKKINSSRDCNVLCEDIYHKFSFKVSSNTLRRFFGLVKSDHAPSFTTLDILSRYCGFSSFDEFISSKNAVPKNEDYYSKSILSYLVSVFKNTPVKSQSDKTFYSIVENTIHFLQRHPALIDKFQREIARTKNGQDYYFEQFVNLDELNSYYGEGLRYYLMHKKTPEAQIFGHSLLCLKHWFSENAEGVKKHHDELMQHKLGRSSHPSLCGRYFATKLLYAHDYGVPIGKILIEMQHTYATIRRRSEENLVFPYFEFMVAPVLFMTGHAEESLHYVNFSLRDYPRRHTAIAENSYQTMNLTKALTLAKTGDKKEAEKLYHEVHPSKFSIMLKKTNTIQYLLLGEYLNKGSEASQQQLLELITETAFVRLKQILK